MYIYFCNIKIRSGSNLCVMQFFSFTCCVCPSVLHKYQHGLPAQDGIFQKTVRSRRPELSSCAGAVSRAAAQADGRCLRFRGGTSGPRGWGLAILGLVQPGGPCNLISACAPYCVAPLFHSCNKPKGAVGAGKSPPPACPGASTWGTAQPSRSPSRLSAA